MRIPFMRCVAWYLAVALFVIGIAPRLDAGMAPSELIVSQFDRAADLAQVQKVLEMKMVQDRLEKLGFTAAEVRAKLDGLSDQEVHQLAKQIDDLRVGQDSAGTVILVILVIILIVIAVLYFTGRKVVVTK